MRKRSRNQRSKRAARSGKSVLRTLSLCGLALLAGAHFTIADELAWTGPWGSAQTLPGAAVVSSIHAQISGTNSPQNVQINYTDFANLPEIAEAGTLGGSAHARASLGIDESNDSGLNVEGHVSAEIASGAFSSASDVRLLVLLTPSNRGSIVLRNLFSAATLSASPGQYFSLQLRRSDAAGTASGATVFSWNGSSPAPADMAIGTDSSNYLLSVTAHAQPGAAAAMDFRFNFDFTAPIPAPEPSASLLLAVGAGGLLARRRR